MSMTCVVLVGFSTTRWGASGSTADTAIPRLRGAPPHLLKGTAMEHSEKTGKEEGGTLLEYGRAVTVRICAASRRQQERSKLEEALRAVQLCLEELKSASARRLQA